MRVSEGLRDSVVIKRAADGDYKCTAGMFQLGFPVAGQEVRGALTGSVCMGRASIGWRERGGFL